MTARKNRDIRRKQQQPTAQLQQKVVQSTVQAFSGPLPAPSDLQEYEETLTGAAHRIIKMAETQAKHRQTYEEVALRAGVSIKKTGQIFGLIITLAGLIGGAYIITSGYQVAGSIFSGVTLIAIVGMFVLNEKRTK